MLDFTGRHFTKLLVLQALRWYLSYPLSYRHVEELMKERGVSVDHSTINRWVIKYARGCLQSPPFFRFLECKQTKLL